MRSVRLLLPLALAACSPVADEAAPEPLGDAPVPPTPAGWRRVDFVAGLTLAAPADATVVRPPGIDSSGLVVTGPGYELFLDDYGAFTGRSDRRIGGRRANRDVRPAPGCRVATWEIELPVRVPYVRKCTPGGGPCESPAGHVTIGSRCAGAPACAAVDGIVGTIGFRPPPYPEPMPIDPNWRPPERPVCEPASAGVQAG